MTAIAKLISIKILVAHDHPALRSHIRTCLEKFGYEVTETESCKQATIVMNTSKFSAMVFNGDAPDFLSESPLIIRCSTINKDTPCIILAQANSLIINNKTFNPKIDDYLLKPFKIEVIAKRIAAIIKPKNLGSITSIGSMTLCDKKGTLTIGGSTSRLPKRQHQILFTLAKHAPRVVHQDLIIAALDAQKECKSSDDTTIKSTIYRLRKSLRDAGSDVRIKNVRGCGYRVQIPECEPSD